MGIILATYRGGQIVPDEPLSCPEGARLAIQPILPADGFTGMREEDQTDDPEAIAAWLARFDALEPLEFTPEEEAEWQRAREAVRDVTLRAVRKRMEETS